MGGFGPVRTGPYTGGFVGRVLTRPNQSVRPGPLGSDRTFNPVP